MDVLQRMPWLAQDAEFQKLSRLADEAITALAKHERNLAYEENLRKYRDTIAVMEGQYLEGMEKGMEKGMAEGKAEGKAEANMENARKMKVLGMSDDVISQVTGLSKADIDSL